MSPWQDLVELPEEALAGLDVAAVNLACAAGLPGAERIDAPRCLAALDAWAAVVERWTAAVYREHYLPDPSRYDHSEPTFRLVTLHNALARRCGVRYDPAQIGAAGDDPVTADSQFLHAVVQGPGGTCASLPVVWVAVGRRLGYPMRLALAPGHVFCRWDDPATGERVNLDGGGGPNCHPDDHYRAWPYRMNPATEAGGGFLRSLTRREELASFLAHRGFVCQDAGQYRGAEEAFAAAARVDGRRLQYPHCLGRASAMRAAAERAGETWDERLLRLATWG